MIMLDHMLFAYIDPVSGFIVIQAIVAGAIGAAVYFRRMIGRGVRLLLGRAKAEE